MNLVDLHKKQKQEIEAFEALRDKIWADLRKRHDAIINAFGSKENLPEESAKKLDKEVNTFISEWSSETGKHYKELAEQHRKQVEAITNPEQDTALSKEQRIQNYIKEQEEIIARNRKRKQKP